MTSQQLRAERDKAFAAYLSTRKAGGRSRYKLHALLIITKEWARAVKAEQEKAS